MFYNMAALVMAEVEIAYLNGLLALQKQIADEFTARLIDNKEGEGEDIDTTDAVKEKAMEGRLNTGADNLYYS